MRAAIVLAYLAPAKGSPLYACAKKAVLESYYAEGFEVAKEKAKKIAEAYEDVRLARALA